MSQIGWMLSFIPSEIWLWLTYALYGLGVILYVASKLVSWIPLMGQYKTPAELIGVLLLMVGAYLFGGYGTEMMWRDRVKALEEKVKAAEAQSQQTNVVIQERVVEKIKVVKQNVYVNREIIKEVVGKQIDAVCSLPTSAVVLHDSASRNEVSRGPGSTDATPSTVKASELIDTVVVNYGTYHQVAEQLRGWQEWYAAQKKIFEGIR